MYCMRLLHAIDQVRNCYVGLIRRSDHCMLELLKQGLFYPLQSNILETEIQTAARVAKLVFDSELARVERPTDMVSFIRRHVYKPAYSSAVSAKKAA